MTLDKVSQCSKAGPKISNEPQQIIDPRTQRTRPPISIAIRDVLIPPTLAGSRDTEQRAARRRAMNRIAPQRTESEHHGPYLVWWPIALGVLSFVLGCGGDDDCPRKVVCASHEKTVVRCSELPLDPGYSKVKKVTCDSKSSFKACCAGELGGSAADYGVEVLGALGVNQCCPTNKSPNQCCAAYEMGSKPLKLSQLPTPDLSYAVLDGVVDLGTSKLRVEVPAEGDHFETNLKGRIAISDGVCSATQKECPLQVLFFELRPAQDPLLLKTARQKSVSGVLVRNEHAWLGKRRSDGTIVMEGTNRLGLEGTIDGTEYAAVLDPTAWFGGTLYRDAIRLTDSGGWVKNNLIRINGSFADGGVHATLTISIWVTSCQPVAHPSAQCDPHVEAGFPGRVELTSTFERLGNMQSSQDLCDTLLVSDPATVCGGGGEIPTFTCKKQPLPSATTPAEVAKQLKFRWTDATGYVLGNAEKMTLHWTPVFPIKLTVENRWGRLVEARVTQPSQGHNCPKAMEYVTDRGGSSYRSFDLAKADPELCQISCDGESQCRSWTYVKPGIQGPSARCWLKHAVPAARPDQCCLAGVKSMEYLTDRAGANYKDFDLAQADPASCQTRCSEDVKCKAWTYVKPGIQGPQARCWLKHAVPMARPDGCCVSAIKGIEYATDRPGSNYKSFELLQADPGLCQISCSEEALCKAWTYVKPGVQGPKARCWLKQEAPTAKASTCCISGVKQESFFWRGQDGASS